MLAAMERLVEMYPSGVKSITCDRGIEFVNFHNVKHMGDTYGIKTYYAHPYAPHERGSNENHNGLLREYYAKSINFQRISQNHIDNSVESINNRPRKTLKWKSANFHFKKEFLNLT